MNLLVGPASFRRRLVDGYIVGAPRMLRVLGAPPREPRNRRRFRPELTAAARLRHIYNINILMRIFIPMLSRAHARDGVGDPALAVHSYSGVWVVYTWFNLYSLFVTGIFTSSDNIGGQHKHA